VPPDLTCSSRTTPGPEPGPGPQHAPSPGRRAVGSYYRRRTGGTRSGVSRKSATDRHAVTPRHPTRRPPSTPQHLLTLAITPYARSGRRGRGFESRHPDTTNGRSGAHDRGLLCCFRAWIGPYSCEVQQRISAIEARSQPLERLPCRCGRCRSVYLPGHVELRVPQDLQVYVQIYKEGDASVLSVMHAWPAATHQQRTAVAAGPESFLRTPV
jgi:hypothetical protein